MKTSELIKRLQESIEHYGDMTIEIRDCNNGVSYFDVGTYDDPASEAEIAEGTEGTFTIEYCDN